MRKSRVVLINVSFVFIETILAFFINVLLFDCMYIYGGTEGTFIEWFQNRVITVILLPCIIAVYCVLMYFAAKKEMISGITFTINAILNAIICIPVLSFCLPGPFSHGAFVPFDERTLLNRFREIVCGISFFVLLVFNVISVFYIIRSCDYNQVDDIRKSHSPIEPTHPFK